MFNTILFDLDGTLLPMDIDKFMEQYLRKISHFLEASIVDQERFMPGLLHGIKAMTYNDGLQTNHDAFWNALYHDYGDTDIDINAVCLEFYAKDFVTIGEIATPNPYAAASVALLKEKGYRLALATNPLFPRIATLQRCQWAGIQPDHFDLITTYEDFSFAKPNLGYYASVLERLGVQAEDCLMVGNDVTEDMAIENIGASTYLVTDFLLNNEDKDTSLYRSGKLEDFYRLAEQLPALETKQS